MTKINHATIQDFFRRYGDLMDDGVKTGKIDVAALTRCFADYVVGSGPAGVMGAKADDDFAATMAGGAQTYRTLGATEFAAEDVAVTGIDDLHAMARVSWRFGYKRPSDGETGTIPFENIYFVSLVAETPRIFAWVTGDETAVLKEHGLN